MSGKTLFPQGVVWTALVLLVIFCPPWPVKNRAEGVENIGAEVYELGKFRVDIGRDHLIVKHADLGSRPIWSRAQTFSWLAAGSSDLKATSNSGSFRFSETTALRCYVRDTAPRPVTRDANRDVTLDLSWPLAGGEACGGFSLTMRLAPINDQRLQITIATDLPGANYIDLALASAPGEHIYGFGLQPTHLDLKGTAFPVWVEEGGIGRGKMPLSRVIDAVSPGTAGTPFTTYFAAPKFLTSHGQGFFLRNSEYAQVDLRQDDYVLMHLHAREMQGEIIAAVSPLAALSAFAEYSGKMAPLPDWAHQGAIIGLQGGTARVRSIWAKLRALGTPVAALWLQDWVGERPEWLGSFLRWNWQLDPIHYPDWSTLVADLKADGVRVMGYINPHLVDIEAAAIGANTPHNLYAEARAKGYLIKNAAGQPYSVRMINFATGMLDLTNAEARLWYKQLIKDNLIGSGMSGWMADFSEALPTDAVLHSGADALAVHNDYAVEWAKLNREALDESKVDGLFFCRGGYTTSPRYAALFWQGDQNVTWDEYDGLKSAVTGLISGGLSGMALNHSDIGGYTAVARGRLGMVRSGELLRRWQEFSAFTAIFRTHEGSDPQGNAQIYSDPESLKFFDRMARIFVSLYPYRRALMQESQAKGWPLARALFLHYPDDPRAYEQDLEFLLGADILVAPVVEPKSTSRQLYLPKGQWVHLWSGTVYGAATVGVTVTVPAPLGYPPVFYRQGSDVGERWTRRLQEMGVDFSPH